MRVGGWAPLPCNAQLSDELFLEPRAIRGRFICVVNQLQDNILEAAQLVLQHAELEPLERAGLNTFNGGSIES